MAASATSLPRLRFRGRPIFYGWAVVTAAFISDFLSYGIGTIAFTVFFAPMSQSLGWSRTLLSSALIVNRFVEAAVTPIVGPMVDKRGPQGVLLIGAAALGLGTAMLGWLESPWQFYLTYGVVMAIGLTGLGSTVSHSIVSKWFVRYRGRALSAVTMGYSLSGIVLPLPATYLILTFGWRSGWVVLGIVTLLLGLVAANISRRQPQDFGLHPDGDAPTEPRAGSASMEAPTHPQPAISFTAREASRTSAFWLLILGSNLGVMAVYGINIHLVPYLLDQGFTPAIAATIFTVLYSMQLLSKPLWGFLSERLHVRYCAAICYLGGGLGLAMVVVWPNFVGIGLFTVVYGLTRGAQSLVMSIAWAEYFGPGSLGAIRGLSAPFGMVAGAAGPVLAGWVFDLFGNYLPAFGIFVAGFWMGSALVFLAHPPTLQVRA